MSEHKLDKKIEDILQHHGVKGMKWGVRNEGERSSSSEGAAGGGGGEEEIDESLLEEMQDKLKDLLSSMDKKFDSISDAIKAKGKSILTSIFGKSKTKYSKAKPNAKTTALFRKAMKDYNDASPTKRKLMKQGYKVTTSVDSKSGSTGSSKTKTTSSGSKIKVHGSKDADRIIEEYKKKGFKKRERSKKSLEERGYKFRIDKSGGD